MSNYCVTKICLYFSLFGNFVFSLPYIGHYITEVVVFFMCVLYKLDSNFSHIYIIYMFL